MHQLVHSFYNPLFSSFSEDFALQGHRGRHKRLFSLLCSFSNILLYTDNVNCVIHSFFVSYFHCFQCMIRGISNVHITGLTLIRTWFVQFVLTGSISQFSS
jgi:hypothetical protein